MRSLGILLILYCEFADSARFELANEQRQNGGGIFERFDGSCPGHNVPIIFNYYGFRTENNKLYFNSNVTAKEDIMREPMMSINIKRCKSRENLDTCEQFHDYKTGKYCSVIASDFWSPIYSAYTPTWKCPIRKGNYTGKESAIDMSAFLLFPIDDWHWRVVGELRDKNTKRLLFCVHIEAHIGMKRSEQTNGQNNIVKILG